MKCLISNTTALRCMNDSDILIDNGIDFEFKYDKASNSYTIWVDSVVSIKATQILAASRNK